MGDRSYLANGVAHSAIPMFAEKLLIRWYSLKKKKIRVVPFGNMWVENWEFRWDFRDIMRTFLEFMLFSTLEGDGAAEGRNVREGGKTWSGGLHEGVRLPSGVHQWRRGRLSFYFIFFPRHFLAPRKGQNTAIFGPTDYFSAVHAWPCSGVHVKNKTKQGSTKKTPEI